jgi:hypothetical protein
MRWLYSFLRRCAAFFGKKRLDAEMEEEMRAHLEMQIEANVARGMPPEEARYAAQREFGGMEQIKEIARDQRGWLWLEQCAQDLGYAVRQLAKNRGFTTVAVLTLAVAIGVNSAAFSSVRDMYLRPLWRDQQMHLVSLYTERADAENHFRRFTYQEFAALRESPEVFTDVAGMIFGYGAIGEGERVQRNLLCAVSENYFSLTGAQSPQQGRFFSKEESQPNAAIAVVVVGLPRKSGRRVRRFF